MNVGNRIKQLREQKGYSVNKLANLSGVSQSYLRDIELSNKNPTVSFIELLCENLDISLSEFFENEHTNSLLEEPLLQKIHQLSPKQREALLLFLNTMQS